MKKKKKYILENHKGQKWIYFPHLPNKQRNFIYSKELDCSLEIRLKDDYKLAHFWVKPGAKILQKIWKNFEYENFHQNFASTISKTLYAHASSLKTLMVDDKSGHLIEQQFIRLSYDLLEHELYHRYQSKEYRFFKLRYGISKKFRLKMEVEAYVYGYKDKISDDNREHYIEKIIKSITSGSYFAKISIEQVEQAVRQEMERQNL